MAKAKEVYLHIGMPKTGSSALQAFFALNEDLLQNEGIFYPNPEKFSQAFQTSSGNGNLLFGLFSKGKTADIRQFISEKLELTQNILLFSSENLFHVIRLHPEFVFTSLQDFNIKIVIYVRRQDELFSSVYNQLVKNHNATRFDLKSISENHDYAKVLMFIRNYLPVERIIVRPYEIEQFDESNIYDDFCNILGVKRNSSFVLPDSIVNPSLSLPALEYRRLINYLKLNLKQEFEKTQLNSLLAEYTVKSGLGQPFSCANIFSTKERIEIIRKYKESNDSIARIFLPRPNGGLFKEEIINKSDDSLNNVKKRDLKKITKYLYKNNKELALEIYSKLKLNDSNNTFSETISRLLPVYESIIHNKEKREIIVNIDKVNAFQKSDIEVFNNMRLLYTINSLNFKQYIKLKDSDIDLNVMKDVVTASFQLSNGQKIALKPVVGNYNSQTCVKIIIDSTVVSSIECHYATRANPKVFNTNVLMKDIKTGRNEIYFLITDVDFNGNIRISTGKNTGMYSIIEITLKTNSKTYHELFIENKYLKSKLSSIML